MDLERLVDQTVDSVIRGFRAEDPGSYDRWDKELERVENLLRGSEFSSAPFLLSSVVAERIRIASEARLYGLVVDLSDHYLNEFGVSAPSFSLVVSWRSEALHALDRHGEEIREGLDAARKPELDGGEYIYLLSSLGARHPGCLPADQGLWMKLRRCRDSLCAQGFHTLPRVDGEATQIEDTVLRIARELRKVNRETGESILDSEM